MPYIFQEIIVRILVLTDAVLGIFVSGATYVAPANLTNCSVGVTTAGTLTDCGNALVNQLGGLIVQGVGLLTAALNALSAQAA
jgi:hypothetical protein